MPRPAKLPDLSDVDITELKLMILAVLERHGHGARMAPTPAVHQETAMERPTYGIDVVALAFAVVLAAAIVLLVSHLMPQLADLMPPALSGTH